MIKGYQTQLLDTYEKIRDYESKQLSERKNEIKRLYPEILDIDIEIQKLSLNLSIAILRSKNPELTLKETQDKIMDLIK